MKVYVLVHKIHARETANYSESYGEWNEGIFLKQEEALSKVVYDTVIDNKYYKHGDDKSYWAEWYEIESHEVE